MKALVCTEPGCFEYEDISKPTLTKGNAVLQIKRVGICGTDLHAFEGTQPYFSYPRIIGHELAADIVELNESEGFSKEEKVTFIPYFNCNSCVACRSGKPNCCVALQVCGVHINGGMVEYLSVPASSLISGYGLSYDELALAEPLAIAAHGVARAAVVQNEFVLVVGAGPIGLGSMEFARLAGGQVIALDINESRLTFCKERLHVQYAINASASNTKALLEEITNGDMPNVIIDATGNLKAINHSFEYMGHGSRYVLIGLQKGNISFNHPEFHKREASLLSSRNATREDFEYVIDCMLKKLINPSVFITHRVKFSEVKENFASWLNPANLVIKAMVEME